MRGSSKPINLTLQPETLKALAIDLKAASVACDAEDQPRLAGRLRDYAQLFGAPFDKDRNQEGSHGPH